MKNLTLIILFTVLSCKHVKQTDPVALIEKEPPQEITLDIYDYAGLEPFLNRQDGKTYVVNFWATWCAPCVKEMLFFEKLNESYSNYNVEVILVSLDFPKQYDSKLKPFIREKGLKSKVIALNDVDTNSWIPKISEEWTGAIPATLIYNDHKRKFYEQSFDYDQLETELKQFIN